MPYKISERVRRWVLERDSEYIQRINELSEYFAKTRYNQYLPMIGPYPEYRKRLSDWLDQLANEADQKILFQLIPHIFFITQREFATLYRAAFKGGILRWLIDSVGLSIEQEGIGDSIAVAQKETWFCPITDSMEVASFCHVNHIEGQDIRPDWYSLWRLEYGDAINRYMRNKGYKRVVLLEDFVGSGSQVIDVLRFAASLTPAIQILAVPLIICPKGVQLIEELIRSYDNLKFWPVVHLPENSLINPITVGGEPDIFVLVRSLVSRISAQVSGIPEGSKYYGPFGYRQTGALVVTYSNCPDNTLPIIHYESHSWKPLFPRSSRV